MPSPAMRLALLAVMLATALAAGNATTPELHNTTAAAAAPRPPQAPLLSSQAPKQPAKPSVQQPKVVPAPLPGQPQPQLAGANATAAPPKPTTAAPSKPANANAATRTPQAQHQPKPAAETKPAAPNTTVAPAEKQQPKPQADAPKPATANATATPPQPKPQAAIVEPKPSSVNMTTAPLQQQQPVAASAPVAERKPAVNDTAVAPPAHQPKPAADTAHTTPAHQQPEPASASTNGTTTPPTHAEHKAAVVTPVQHGLNKTATTKTAPRRRDAAVAVGCSAANGTLLPAGTPCKASSDPCVRPSTCNGTSAACPRRAARNGTPCSLAPAGLFTTASGPMGRMGLSAGISSAEAKERGWHRCYRCFEGECVVVKGREDEWRKGYGHSSKRSHGHVTRRAEAGSPAAAAASGHSSPVEPWFYCH